MFHVAEENSARFLKLLELLALLELLELLDLLALLELLGLRYVGTGYKAQAKTSTGNSNSTFYSP